MGSGAFRALFALPADTPSSAVTKINKIIFPVNTTANCYQYMFQANTGVIISPSLPATTMAEYCYASMFNGCTSLTTAPPSLPITTMAEYCCFAMFYNCTSLTTPPSLPATTLADYCYYAMFYNCTRLARANALRALHYPIGCCAFMYTHSSVTASGSITSTHTVFFRVPIEGTATCYDVSSSDTTYPTYGMFTAAVDSSKYGYAKVNGYLYVQNPLVE